MRLSSILRELPPDIRVVSSRRGALAVRAELAPAFLAAGFEPNGAPRLDASELVGKRQLEELSAGEERFVVRRFRHGGLLRWLTRARFLDPERPFRELLLQRGLQRHGVRSPEVVAARALRARLGGWTLLVASRRLEGSLDLGAVLAQRAARDLESAAWKRLLAATGSLVAQLHAIGFLHADLTPRNLAVVLESLTHDRPRLWVLDLDRSRFAAPLGERARRDNLRRLYRHLERLGGEHGLRLGSRDLARFLSAYQPVREARHADWRAISAAHLRGWRLHTLGWYVERLLGRGRSGTERHLGTSGGRGDRRRSQS